MFDFDKPVDRRGFSSVKYDALKEVFGREDLIPLWVADMDLQSPPCVLQAAREVCDMGAFGYTRRSEKSTDYFIKWVEQRYGWGVKKEWTSSAPGIVAALPISLMAYTNPGDKILIQTPVYPPFHSIVKENGRELICSPLIKRLDGYFIDFAEFEKRVSSGVKMFILCNSHNPLGRVWSRDELKLMGDICCKYGVVIFSDEIHADLSLYGNKHTVMASVSREISMNTITAMAPSKTFNIAGMMNSIIVSESEILLKKYDSILKKMHLDLGNIFAHITMEAAYREGSEWLNSLVAYLEKNCDYVFNRLQNDLPAVRFIKPQSSFLLWLDFTATGLSHNQIQSRLINQARVGLNDGLTFGDEGEFHFRMNIGTQRALLEQAIDRIVDSFG